MLRYEAVICSAILSQHHGTVLDNGTCRLWRESVLPEHAFPFSDVGGVPLDPVRTAREIQVIQRLVWTLLHACKSGQPVRLAGQVSRLGQQIRVAGHVSRSGQVNRSGRPIRPDHHTIRYSRPGQRIRSAGYGPAGQVSE